MKTFSSLSFLLLLCAFGFDKPVYKQDFEKKDVFARFRFTQPEKWILTEGKSGKALEFTGISDYQPPFRSPHTIGLISDMTFGNFVLEADLLQTGKEYGHRDMCVIFGFQDPSHFYYSHIATKMDDNAHQIMVVNNAPRTKISSFTTQGVEWGDKVWHKVRVERNIESGSIKIFFDGTLIEEATDKTFGIGYIGFGSFDDSGKIDNVRIWGDAEKSESTAFRFKD
ncbi:MAG TPA: hypothetical protein VGD65_01375 [Chryseosolibacter sp.]